MTPVLKFGNAQPLKLGFYLSISEIGLATRNSFRCCRVFKALQFFKMISKLIRTYRTNRLRLLFKTILTLSFPMICISQKKVPLDLLNLAKKPSVHFSNDTISSIYNPNTLFLFLPKNTFHNKFEFSNSIFL